MKINKHMGGLIVKSVLLPALMLLVVSCGQRATDSDTTKNTTSQRAETMFNPVEGKGFR